MLDRPSPKVSAALEADLDAWKAPPEFREHVTRRTQKAIGPFGVFPCNWYAVRWFLAAQTQLRAIPGGVFGFDYQGAELARQWIGLDDPTPWDFTAFRLIESEACAIYNDRASA